MNELSLPLHPLPFGLPSHSGCHGVLSRLSCAISYVFVVIYFTHSTIPVLYHMFWKVCILSIGSVNEYASIPVFQLLPFPLSLIPPPRKDLVFQTSSLVSWCQHYNLCHSPKKSVLHLHALSLFFPSLATTKSDLTLSCPLHYFMDESLNSRPHSFKFIDHTASKRIYLKHKSGQVIFFLLNTHQPKSKGRR